MMPRVEGALARLRYMAEHEVKPGAQLPPERELAGRLGVSRGTLRRALEMLEAEGKIWRHVGQGTFAGTRPLSIAANVPVTRLTSPAEVMELRLMLEPRMAGMAALRASAEDIAQMEACLRKGDAATSAEAYELWDGTLHGRIAEAARNRLLLAVFNTVNAVRGDKLWGQLKRAILTQSRQRIYWGQHRRLVAAIRDRDEAAAERTMRDHLETVERDLLSSRA